MSRSWHVSTAALRRSFVGHAVPGAWTLAVLNVVCAALCLLATVAPIAPDHFVARGFAFAIGFLAIGLFGLLAATNLPRSGLPAALFFDVALLCTALSWARGVEGTLIVVFTFIWWGIYAASFLTSSYYYASLVAITVGSATSLEVNGIAYRHAVWLIVMATTWASSLIVHHSLGRLRFEAETDSLTGLLNRRGFLKAAPVARSMAERFGLQLAVVVLDLDHFKELNDSKGHAAGDEALVEVSAAWKATLRDGDLLARFGGDEFVMMLASEHWDDATGVLARCAIAHPISFTSGTARLSRGEDLVSCIHAADEDLYANKLARVGTSSSDRTRHSRLSDHRLGREHIRRIS